MITIQLSTGALDVYDNTDMQLEWTAFRFQKALRDTFSNDITIPKTKNNVNVLSAAGMLDSTTQMFGNKTAPADMSIGSYMMPIYLQIVALRRDEIDICVYEARYPQDIKEHSWKYGLIDNSSSIYEWNKNSVTNYPDVFRSYRYATFAYNTTFAQYHPTVPLNMLLVASTWEMQYPTPSLPQSYRILCSKKKVCPQNHIQVIEAQWGENNNYALLSGGQHITNNMELDWNSDKREITFNRQCNVNMTVYISYDLKGDHLDTNNKFFQLIMKRNTNYPAQAEIVYLPEHYQNGIITKTWQVANNYVQSGTTFQLQAREDYNHYRNLKAVIVMTITDYEITEDDYDIDLQYVGRLPRLGVTSRTSLTNYPVTYRSFDGHSFSYTRRNFSDGSTSTVYFTLPRKSISYFGAYCNLPDMKLTDALFSLQWIYGKKLMFSYNSGFYWQEPNVSMNIKGIIDEIRPHSDSVGQNNYIVFRDSTDEPAWTIPNEWLSANCKIFESKFLDATHLSLTNWPPEIIQYSNAEYDDNGYPQCDFNEPEAPVILNLSTTLGLRVIPLNKFDLTKLTQCMEVDITTYAEQVRDADIIYLDGRSFFVISGSTNMGTKESKLKCLLIPPQITTQNNNQYRS